MFGLKIFTLSKCHSRMCRNGWGFREKTRKPNFSKHWTIWGHPFPPLKSRNFENRDWSCFEVVRAKFHDHETLGGFGKGGQNLSRIFNTGQRKDPHVKIKPSKVGLLHVFSWPKLGLEPKCHDPGTFGGFGRKANAIGSQLDAKGPRRSRQNPQYVQNPYDHLHDIRITLWVEYVISQQTWSVINLHT